MSVIRRADHPLVKHFVKLRTKRTYRNQEGALLISGNKLVFEYCQNKKARLVIAKENTDTASLKFEQIVFLQEHLMKKVTGLEEPEDLAALVDLPEPQLLHKKEKSASILVFDQIADPGNMGALLRSAKAFSWTGVFITPQCVDLFNDKVLRAARGAHFSLPYQLGSWQDLKALAGEGQFKTILADLKGEAPKAFMEQKKLLLIVSNEAKGPSKQALALAQKKVTLEIADDMESLNVAVAGGILMYLLRPRDV